MLTNCLRRAPHDPNGHPTRSYFKLSGFALTLHDVFMPIVSFHDCPEANLANLTNEGINPMRPFGGNTRVQLLRVLATCGIGVSCFHDYLRCL